MITAHPDDAEFGCAGTIAKWVGTGEYEVEYVVCTSGNKGTRNSKLTPQDLAALREREQEAAARELGVRRCLFLRHDDGELETTMAFRAELALVLRQLRPDIVFTFDPWKHYQIHPDHRAVGTAAIDAIAAARDHLYFPEQLLGGLTSHRVKELYLFTPQEPNFWVDITDAFDKKIAALLKHESQNYLFSDLRERIQARAEETGRAQGMKLAEAFHREELR